MARRRRGGRRRAQGGMQKAEGGRRVVAWRGFYQMRWTGNGGGIMGYMKGKCVIGIQDENQLTSSNCMNIV